MAHKTTSSNTYLYIEGIGDLQKSQLDSNYSFLNDHLPTKFGEVVYISNWPLLVINLGNYKRGYNKYFISYNPQTKEIKRLITHYEGQSGSPEDIPTENYQGLIKMINSNDLINLYKYQQAEKQILDKYIPTKPLG